ncbi:MAG TPA: beta-ribofuranosylaminobenzene 5'-phosphate synthase family protein [Chitinophagaceae bacterium]|nr:beta-ribofuranosylaminobenzene 5'-phosphate synthase family protein [Chitinophagaceae bacterium]
MSIERVTITTPSRLAFTLINLSRGCDRINGGAGVALSNPKFKCQVEQSNELKLQFSNNLSFPYVEQVNEFVVNLLENINCPPVQIRIIEQIPPHTGFGSKTATLLSVGRAIVSLYRKEISTDKLAKMAHRAGTSGVGVNTFDKGGFIIDGGHAISVEQQEAADIFLPSRFSRMKTVPPILFSGKIPWKLTVIVPKGKLIQGEAELAHFRNTCPIPINSVYEIAHIVCFRMPSAIIEQDYWAFCRAINELQSTYWKLSQINNQTEEVKYIINNARKHGFDAVGISSNGPALYGLSRDTQRSNEWLHKLTTDKLVETFWHAIVPSKGAVLRRTIVEGRAK